MKGSGVLARSYNPKEKFTFADEVARVAREAISTPPLAESRGNSVGEIGSVKDVVYATPKQTPKAQSSIVNVAELLAHASEEEARLRQRAERLDKDPGTSVDQKRANTALADDALKVQMAIYNRFCLGKDGQETPEGKRIRNKAQEISQGIHGTIIDPDSNPSGFRRHLDVMRQVEEIVNVKKVEHTSPSPSRPAEIKRMREELDETNREIRQLQRDLGKSPDAGARGPVAGKSFSDLAGSKTTLPNMGALVDSFLAASSAIVNASRGPSISLGHTVKHETLKL